MARNEPIVLYVEDEEMDRFFMALAFDDAGLAGALRMVKDGREAIDYLSGVGQFANREQYPLPMLVLLDLNLPEVHGFEVLRWIRTQSGHSTLPVVVFSSSEREDDQVQARVLGANDFENKPGSGFRFSDVVRRLHERWLAALST